LSIQDDNLYTDDGKSKKEVNYYIMLSIKKKGNRYYREDRFSMRSFPIKKSEVEKLITEGKSELVDFFVWELREYNAQKEEVQQEVKPSNVFDITGKLKEKQEQEKTQEAINKFMSEYLPKLTHDDINTILTASDQKDFGERIIKICWRIDLEKGLKG
jgi:hypothetical protein